MKLPALLTLSLIAALTFSSCGDSNNPENAGESTPIDSTNLHGTAPATYGPENPATTGEVPHDGYDTSLRANTASSEDSAKGKAH